MFTKLTDKNFVFELTTALSVQRTSHVPVLLLQTALFGRQLLSNVDSCVVSKPNKASMLPLGYTHVNTHLKKGFQVVKCSVDSWQSSSVILYQVLVKF